MEDGAETRERVLDVALDLFIEQGYDKASLREIAERVGFTKAALYYHFPSKADILGALHERFHRLLGGPMSILGNGPVSLGTFEEFLDACIDEMQVNQKLFTLHRVNQAALADVHVKGHDGAHLELEERARKLMSDPELSAKARLRMMAAFAVAFVTPMMTSGFLVTSPPFVGGEDFVNDLKNLVKQVLHAP
jgi:AcrR family transcriptional regulator